METIMGLDFGTTNSALALFHNSAVKVLNINNKETDERTLSSVLFFDEEDGIFVGQQAIDQYVNFGGIYGRFLQSLKAYLPQPTFTETRIFGKKYELEDLVSLILSEIKRLGEAHVGSDVNRVILGRPVVFSEQPERDALAEKRLLEAAHRAGFKDVAFEYEPIAATLAYAEHLKSDDEQLVLMGDFGGGTSDFNVMRLRRGPISQTQKKDRILSIGGVAIGGDTLDSRIMWEKIAPYFGKDSHFAGMRGQALPIPISIVRTICEWHKIPFLRKSSTIQTIREIKLRSDNPLAIGHLEALILENKGFYIFQAIEQAKKQLSVSGESRICYRDSSVEIDETINRAEFERFISDELASISTCVSETLTAAGVSEAQIDLVLLTGGSSFVPGIRHLFEKRFGKRKVVYPDAFTSVAHGLALSGSLI